MYVMIKQDYIMAVVTIITNIYWLHSIQYIYMGGECKLDLEIDSLAIVGYIFFVGKEISFGVLTCSFYKKNIK